jgi:hypothetical protein
MYPPFYAHCFSLDVLRLLPLFFILRSWPFSEASSVSLRRNRGTKVCSGFSRFLFPVFLQFLSVSCVLYFLPFVAPSLSPLFFSWFRDPLSLVFSLSLSLSTVFYFVHFVCILGTKAKLGTLAFCSFLFLVCVFGPLSPGSFFLCSGFFSLVFRPLFSPIPPPCWLRLPLLL